MAKSRITDTHTRDKIFRSATQVFEEKGYSGARMQEIADRAGINKALLHYYFRSKDQLFMAVFQVLIRKMFEKIIAIFSGRPLLQGKNKTVPRSAYRLPYKEPQTPDVPSQ